MLSKRDLLDGKKIKSMNFCEHYVFDKQIRVKFDKKAVCKTRGMVDYIHLDLWGPNRISSKSDARYFMTLIDDYSRMVWVYFLKTKDEAFSTFVKWKTMIQKQTEKKVKRLRTDD